VLAIHGGTVLSPDKRIENAVILVENGKIVDVGEGVAIPEGAERIDATGKVITPGLIDAHCHTGIFANGVGSSESDGNEMTDPITPQLRSIDAIFPADPAFEGLRAAGVTTIGTGPGSANLVGGMTCAIKTRGRTIEEMLVEFPVGMKMALGENPKRVYGAGQKKTPSTRMGNAAVLREWLTKAQLYVERKALHAKKLADFQAGVEGANEPDPFETDLKLEALGKVVSGEIQAHIHAHRADDIMTAIRIAEEFGFPYILIHATEGYKIADILAEKQIACVPGPVLISALKYELRDMTPENAGLLAKAGVKIAIQTDEMSATRYLALNGALAVSQGLDEDVALRAITLSAAEILGIDDRVGSIEKGKDADLVIMTSHPFDIAHCHVERVLIDGETVYER